MRVVRTKKFLGAITYRTWREYGKTKIEIPILKTVHAFFKRHEQLFLGISLGLLAPGWFCTIVLLWAVTG